MRRKLLTQNATTRVVKNGKRPNGGKRPGAGRPPGSLGKKTIAFDEYVSKVLDEATGKGSKPSALELYQALYSDPLVPQAVRRDAMARALPFEDARRKATEMTDPHGSPLASRLENAHASLESKLIKGAGPGLDTEVGKKSNSG